ncbi:MAG TPA: fluoride efflux transporter CrcB [Solirubrobacteraceae bacterium]|nr:fluoride efflux transporter CrcB [Solirubrobacteraceae bacterium]
MSAWVWAAVVLLGGAGAIGRFLLDTLVSGRAGRAFPLGTLAVNASGALLLGLLSGLAATGDVLLLAGTATIGSYTTFSTWMLESHRLAEGSAPGGAAANLVLSLGVGFAAALAGHAIGASA